MVLPQWPMPRAKYDDSASDEEEQRRWQRSFEDGFQTGTLQLEPTGTPHVKTLRGECPRCGHELEGIDIYGSVIMGATAVKNGVAITNVTCNCNKAHSGRPPGKTGCGWAPNLNVTFIWPASAEV